MVRRCTVTANVRSLWAWLATATGTTEYYAMTSIAEVILLFKAVFEFFGYKVLAKVLSDSLAACGIARREGLKPCKHLETKAHWLQQLAKKKILSIQK